MHDDAAHLRGSSHRWASAACRAKRASLAALFFTGSRCSWVRGSSSPRSKLQSARLSAAPRLGARLGALLLK
jgi:hypothetical protein